MEDWKFLLGSKSQETSNSGSVASYSLAFFSFCLHCTEHPGKRPGAESCFSFSAKKRSETPLPTSIYSLIQN